MIAKLLGLIFGLFCLVFGFMIAELALKSFGQKRVVELAIETATSGSFFEQRFEGDIVPAEIVGVRGMYELFDLGASSLEKFRTIVEHPDLDPPTAPTLLSYDTENGQNFYFEYVVRRCLDVVCKFDETDVVASTEEKYQNSVNFATEFLEENEPWLWYNFEISYGISRLSSGEVLFLSVSISDLPTNFLDVWIRQLEQRKPPYYRGEIVFQKSFPLGIDLKRQS